MLQGRGDGSISGSPIDGPGGDVHAVGGGMGQGDSARVRTQNGGGSRSGLGPPFQRILPEVAIGSAGAQLPGLRFGHGVSGLPGQRPGRAGVQVDARGRGRKRFTDCRDLLVVGEKWGHHRRL